jgi:hypothetical protein
MPCCRTGAGLRCDQDPADAARPERGVASIAASVPVRTDAFNRRFDSTIIRLMHVEALPNQFIHGRKSP